MNNFIFIAGGAGILAYIVVKSWDMIKTTSTLKEIFSDGKGEETKESYIAEIAELDGQIAELEDDLNTNAKVDAGRKQKSIARSLIKKIEKLTKRKNEYEKSLHLYTVLYDDYKSNQGSTPTSKMTKDLKAYLQAKKRL